MVSRAADETAVSLTRRGRATTRFLGDRRDKRVLRSLRDQPTASDEIRHPASRLR